MPGSELRILLDQNVPFEVAAWLRQTLEGTHQVDHAFDLGLATSTDDKLYAFAQSSKSMIVTYDEDFADQRLFPVEHHYGIVRLRVQPATAEVTCAALERLFSSYKAEDLVGKLVIIQPSRIRIIPE